MPGNYRVGHKSVDKLTLCANNLAPGPPIVLIPTPLEFLGLVLYNMLDWLLLLLKTTVIFDGTFLLSFFGFFTWSLILPKFARLNCAAAAKVHFC